jgi:hypothetical protein
MKLKGYYYFLDKFDQFSDIISYFNNLRGLAIGFYYVLKGKVKSKVSRVFGDDNRFTYGNTILLSDVNVINSLVSAGILKSDLIVEPMNINNNEWNNKDRLKKAKYFKNIEELKNYIQKNLI